MSATVTDLLITDKLITAHRDLSGRWDSNPRISAWKADALPLGDSRVRARFYHIQNRQSRLYIQIEKIESKCDATIHPEKVKQPQNGNRWKEQSNAQDTERLLVSAFQLHFDLPDRFVSFPRV
jgi:hypothetical protein